MNNFIYKRILKQFIIWLESTHQISLFDAHPNTVGTSVQETRLAQLINQFLSENDDD